MLLSSEEHKYFTTSFFVDVCFNQMNNEVNSTFSPWPFFSVSVQFLRKVASFLSLLLLTPPPTPTIPLSLHHSLCCLVIKQQFNLQSSLIIEAQKKPGLFRFLSVALIEPLTSTLTQLLFTQADGKISQRHDEAQMHHVCSVMLINYAVKST